MKTLDEVIKEQERCNTYPNCHFCYLHSGSICSSIRDALHYLKAYRDGKDDLTALRAYWKEQYDNPPLTWDELKTMKGKPVWVEWISGCWKGSSKWVLINGIDDLMIMFTAIDVAMESYGGHFREISLGKTWQAYRKELR